jgi:hypothetical protein
MRHWCPCSLIVLLFQVCDHAWCEKKSCADEHLHTKCKEECPGRVVCVQGTTSEASSEICDDEQYAAVARMIVPAKDARVPKGRDLKRTVSILLKYKVEFRQKLTTAPVIIVVFSSAKPTPIARLTCPACAKDSNPTIASARGPVSSPGTPDRSTSATTSTSIAWKNVVRSSHDRLRVRTRCASWPKMKLPMMNL